MRKEFEKIIKEQNELFGISDNNLEIDEDGDYKNYQIDNLWFFYKKGYEKGIKQMEPPNFD